ncbi:MAG: hypothetical protein R3A80_11870 [Bdellovibrionota bacterium]
MVQRSFLQVLLFSSVLFLQMLHGAPEKEDFAEVGEHRKIPYALRPDLMATNSVNQGTDKKWVTFVTTYTLEATNLKALQFDIQAGRATATPVYFLVVNEQNIERGKNAQGEVESASKARIVLTLSSLMTVTARAPSGELITRANTANFYVSADKPLTVEIRNDNVSKIESWSQPGNYFYRESQQGDIPALKFENIVPFKSDLKAGAMSSEDLRRSILSQ